MNTLAVDRSTIRGPASHNFSPLDRSRASREIHYQYFLLWYHRFFGPKNELQKKKTSHPFSVTSSSWYQLDSHTFDRYSRPKAYLFDSVKRSLVQEVNITEFRDFETLCVEIRKFCPERLLLSGEKTGFQKYINYYFFFWESNNGTVILPGRPYPT